MYKIAELTIRPQYGIKEEQLENTDQFLGMLYKNGQILDGYTVEDRGDVFIARVVTTDDDSLDSKYFNVYIRNMLDKLTFEYEIIADDALSDDSCHESDHSFLMLRAEYDISSSPVYCGDCGREIPLIHLPYIENREEHFSILSWQKMYKNVDSLWMSSLSDRFTKRQITDPNSALNKSGAEICAELEKRTGIPTYLYLRNPIGGWYDYKKNNINLKACPKCGGEFRYPDDSAVDMVCDKCRLAFLLVPEE